ncbi:unnamed protein product [Brassicogethes aeneus]|uniref:MADF domain-containing protein n=1 Tax=Brassicogethes aeneus TaxID=1431903 RepID=A0A9P0AYL0_BRAAE|nr:unnamed protein product [Brassicogethes aeneus]
MQFNFKNFSTKTAHKARIRRCKFLQQLCRGNQVKQEKADNVKTLQVKHYGAKWEEDDELLYFFARGNLVPDLKETPDLCAFTGRQNSKSNLAFYWKYGAVHRIAAPAVCVTAWNFVSAIRAAARSGTERTRAAFTALQSVALRSLCKYVFLQKNITPHVTSHYATNCLIDKMSFKEEFLIKTIENHPVIYDKSLAAYKNTNAREKAWTEVGKICNLEDIEYIKKRWRTLRDAFIKNYRSSNIAKNGKKKRKWIFFDQMLFLVPHIEYKDTGSNQAQHDDDSFAETFQIVTNNDNNDDEDDDDNEDETVEEAQSSQGHEIENRKIRFIKKKYDADECFMLSCVPCLRRLSPQNNMLARIQIQNLLFKLEFGENLEEFYSSTSKNSTIHKRE